MVCQETIMFGSILLGCRDTWHVHGSVCICNSDLTNSGRYKHTSTRTHTHTNNNNNNNNIEEEKTTTHKQSFNSLFINGVQNTRTRVHRPCECAYIQLLYWCICRHVCVYHIKSQDGSMLPTATKHPSNTLSFCDKCYIN